MFFVYKFCIVVCFIAYAYYLILCDMGALCFLLYDGRLRPSLPYISSIKATYNEANERCIPLCVASWVRSFVPSPHPPLWRSFVGVHPHPNFFLFFSSPYIPSRFFEIFYPYFML